MLGRSRAAPEPETPQREAGPEPEGVVQPHGNAANAEQLEAERQCARDALDEYLDVVDPEKLGRAPFPNEVTACDFEEIATLYADILGDRTDLHIAPEGLSPRFTAEVVEATAKDLAKILATVTGRDLLADLAVGEKGLQTHIRWTGSPEDAYASPLDKGEMGRDGSGAEVAYTPGEAAEIGGPQWGHVPSDVVLFHELTHARHMQGGDVPAEIGETGDVLGYPSVDEMGLNATDPGDVNVIAEEYATVGLDAWADDPRTENGYRAEREQVTGERTDRRTSYAIPATNP